MAILVVVFAVLVVSYASSMRAYLEQRSHVSDLRAQIASSEQQIDALKQEKARWKDDAYVEQQARERFGWVLPGETAYQVIGPDGKPIEGTDRLGDPAVLHQRTPEAWWGKAWSTLAEADHPHRNDKPTPLSKIVPPKTQQKD
jgi:cell division protein FtsB